jgi:hypothetical protein
MGVDAADAAEVPETSSLDLKNPVEVVNGLWIAMIPVYLRLPLVPDHRLELDVDQHMMTCSTGPGLNHSTDPRHHPDLDVDRDQVMVGIVAPQVPVVPGVGSLTVTKPVEVACLPPSP